MILPGSLIRNSSAKADQLLPPDNISLIGRTICPNSGIYTEAAYRMAR